MKKSSWILLVIFLIALLPRIWGISDFLPNYFHPDEDKEIRRAVYLLQGKFQDRVHKGMLFVILAGEYAALYGYERITGQVNHPEEFAISIADDHSMLFLLSRLTVALMGAGCAALAFSIVNRLSNVQTGVLAAALITLFSLHLELSRQGRLDVPLCFWILLFMDQSISMIQSPTTRRLYALSIIGGLIVATKTSGLPFLITALPGAYLLRRFGSIFIAFGLFILTLFLFNHALVDSLLSFQSGIRQPNLIEQYSGSMPNPFEHYIMRPVELLTPLTLIGGLFGVIIYLWKGTALEKLTISSWVLSILIQITLLWALSDLVSVRYLLPSLLTLFLLAALSVHQICRMITQRSGRQILFLILSTLLILPQFIGAKERMRIDTLKPATIAAEEWIQERIPNGETIFLEGKSVFPSQTMPQIQQTASSLQKKIDSLQETEPNKARVLKKYWLPTRNTNGYDVRLYSYSNPMPSIEDLKRQGVKWIVIRDHEVSDESNNQWSQTFRSFRSQFDSYKPEVVIDGENQTHRGPTLRIYKI